MAFYEVSLSQIQWLTPDLQLKHQLSRTEISDQIDPWKVVQPTKKKEEVDMGIVIKEEEEG